MSLVVGLTACGPEPDPPLADGSWVVGHYLRAACSMTGGRPDTIEGCWNPHYHAVEFTATVGSVEVHRTDDCLTADVFETDIPGRVQPPYLLLRGEFTYEPSIEGCEPVAMYIEPPTCPEPVDADG